MTINLMNLLFNGMNCNYGSSYYNIGGYGCSSFINSAFSLIGNCCNTTGKNCSGNSRMFWQQFLAGGLVAFANWGIGKLIDNSAKKEAEAAKAAEAAEAAAEAERLAQEKEKNEVTIRQILTNNNIQVSEEILNQIVEKYPTMKTIQTGGLTPEQRVVNYANGLQYDKVTDAFVLAKRTDSTSTEVYEIQKGQGTEEDEQVKNGFLNFAVEQVELYDLNSDGKINFDEFFAKELADSIINESELNEQQYEEALNGSDVVFRTLDTDNNKFLDKVEMASLSWVQSTINLSDTNVNTSDTYNNITFNEWEKTQEILHLYQTVVMEKLPTDKIKEFYNIQSERGAALNFLKEHSSATEEEIEKLANFFKRYDESVAGFLQHLLPKE